MGGEKVGAGQVLGGSWRVSIHTGPPADRVQPLSPASGVRGGRVPSAQWPCRSCRLQPSARDSAGVSPQASTPGPPKTPNPFGVGALTLAWHSPVPTRPPTSSHLALSPWSWCLPCWAPCPELQRHFLGGAAGPLVLAEVFPPVPDFAPSRPHHWASSAAPGGAGCTLWKP